jgi:putative phosphoribosyl transferase
MRMFHDRADAGRQLLSKLGEFDPAETVVIALPRGGVPVAEIIAEELGAPLDVAIVRKVGLPGQRELAVGAVTDSDDPMLHVNKDVAHMAGLSEADIWALAEPEIAEAERRRAAYVGDRKPWSIRDKVALVIDDGAATGSTMFAALEMLRSRAPKRITVALPVAPEETASRLASKVDQLICLETPRPFRAVGCHYGRFDQVPDQAVASALSRNMELMQRTQKLQQ